MSKETYPHWMQANEYLEEIGIPRDKHSCNQVKPDWIQRDQKKAYGFDAREMDNLNTTFAEWLYSHCKMYLETGDVDDLQVYKLKLGKREMTQKEAIDEIIELTKYYLLHKDVGLKEKSMKKLQKATKLWARILPWMWW